MKLVLDTSALWDGPLAEALIDAHALGLTEDGRLHLLLPAVAYAERLRQLTRDDQDVALWREDIAAMGIAVEPFGLEQAARVPQLVMSNEEWRRDARDAMVAAHVVGDRTAVTSDTGRIWSQVDAISPADATAIIRALLA